MRHGPMDLHCKEPTILKQSEQNLRGEVFAEVLQNCGKVLRMKSVRVARR